MHWPLYDSTFTVACPCSLRTICHIKGNSFIHQRIVTDCGRVMAVRCVPTFARQSPFRSDRGCGFVTWSRSLLLSSHSSSWASLSPSAWWPASAAVPVMSATATKKYLQHLSLSTQPRRVRASRPPPPTAPTRYLMTDWRRRQWMGGCCTTSVDCQLHVMHFRSEIFHSWQPNNLTQFYPHNTLPKPHPCYSLLT